MISRSSWGRVGLELTSWNTFLVCMRAVLSVATLGRAAPQPAVPPRFPAVTGRSTASRCASAGVRLGSDLSSPATGPHLSTAGSLYEAGDELTRLRRRRGS